MRNAAAPSIFKQNNAPDATSDLVANPGDLWVDQSQSPPVVKKCTGINPFVWASIEGGASSINFADEEVPTGTINSSNVTYTLAHSPSPAAALLLYLNGVLQHQGAGKDYTLAAATITFQVAPTTGDVLLAWYRF